MNLTNQNLKPQNLKPKERIKLANQSLVFEALSDDEKLTIREISFKVNSKLTETEHLSERTIRRAIEDLCALGQLKPFGKSPSGAQTYGKLSATFTGSAQDEIIPFGGNLIGVEDFIKLMTDPDTRPLKRNTNLLAEKSQHNIRRMMVFAIISASDAGNNEQLSNVHAQLHNAIVELQFALDALKGFVNSAVWFQQYRDKIALAMREVIKNDPELYKLALDYVRSE